MVFLVVIKQRKPQIKMPKPVRYEMKDGVKVPVWEHIDGRPVENYSLGNSRGHNSYTFETSKAEYGTDIAVLPDKRVISPRKPDEKYYAGLHFTSKGKGQFLLREALRGTAAKMLNFQYLEARSLQKIGMNGLMQMLDKPGRRILIRSDNFDKETYISEWDRHIQARAHFPNTVKGREEAAQLIRDLNPHYGVIIHHLETPKEHTTHHGRVFINGTTGEVKIIAANRDPGTDTFARWEHHLVSEKKGKRVDVSNPGVNISKQLIDTCHAAADRLLPLMRREKYPHWTTATFVIYNNRVLEFFDLLHVHGLKELDLNHNPF